jgi:putative FmdB family regulatory protein
MPMYDYKCMKCDSTFEKIVPLTEEHHIICCPKCNSEIVEKVFPKQMNFKLGRGKYDTCGWHFDGYQSRVPTEKVFKEDGEYQDEYQRKHDKGGTDIND